MFYVIGKTINNFSMLSWLAMGCRLSLRLLWAHVSSVRRSFDKFVSSLSDCRSILGFKDIIQICDKILLSFLSSAFYLLSVNFVSYEFCFSIICVGESSQILPQGLSFYRTSLMQKTQYFKNFGSAFDAVQPPTLNFRSAALDTNHGSWWAYT